jgi:hypothetical protein
MSIFGIGLFGGSVLGAALIGLILGGISAAASQFSKHRSAKQFKENMDDLQKRISQLPKDATKEQFDKVMDEWKRQSE